MPKPDCGKFMLAGYRRRLRSDQAGVGLVGERRKHAPLLAQCSDLWRDHHTVHTRAREVAHHKKNSMNPITVFIRIGYSGMLGRSIVQLADATYTCNHDILAS